VKNKNGMGIGIVCCNIRVLSEKIVQLPWQQKYRVSTPILINLVVFFKLVFLLS
jgi:hypothetical protein